MSDNVNHPKHYTSHPSGIECIEITKHHCFCVGNAIKYLWHAGLKGDDNKEIEDLKKAAWYVNQKIKDLELAALQNERQCTLCTHEHIHPSDTPCYSCAIIPSKPHFEKK
jgi:hypothetical protein